MTYQALFSSFCHLVSCSFLLLVSWLRKFYHRQPENSIRHQDVMCHFVCVCLCVNIKIYFRFGSINGFTLAAASVSTSRAWDNWWNSSTRREVTREEEKLKILLLHKNIIWLYVFSYHCLRINSKIWLCFHNGKHLALNVAAYSRDISDWHEILRHLKGMYAKQNIIRPLYNFKKKCHRHLLTSTEIQLCIPSQTLTLYMYPPKM